MSFFLCLALLFGFGVPWPFVTEAGAQTAASSAALIEGAKKEGQVVFYTPLNINDPGRCCNASSRNIRLSKPIYCA